MAGWGDVAVTKGMCYKQKMAVREGKSPWRRGKSRSGGKDSHLQERYDRRKKRRCVDEVKTERPSRKPEGGGKKGFIKEKEVRNLGTMANNNNNK